MKISVTRFLPALCLMILTSCSKQPDTPAQEQPLPQTKLSRLEYDNNFVDVSYDASGRINKLTAKTLSGVFIQDYAFTYQNGKLDRIDFGSSWRYAYLDNLIIKVESYNLSGGLKHYTTYGYTNERVTEKEEYLITSQGATPYMRTLYTYNADGNISKKRTFQYQANAWVNLEEMTYPEYDNHPNTSQVLEDNPYLPTPLCRNNPLKEVFKDDLGRVTQTVEHQYTYDASGRPVTRKTTYKPTGFPEEVENTKLFY